MFIIQGKELQNKINSILYGIRISIKIIARVKGSSQEIINILCKLQTFLKWGQFENNLHLYKAIQDFISQYKY